MQWQRKLTHLRLLMRMVSYWDQATVLQTMEQLAAEFLDTQQAISAPYIPTL